MQITIATGTTEKEVIVEVTASTREDTVEEVIKAFNKISKEAGK